MKTHIIPAALPSLIRLGPLTLQLAFRDERFTGLGEVQFEGAPLCSPSIPWKFYTESEAGFRFSEFDLLEVLQTVAGRAARHQGGATTRFSKRWPTAADFQSSTSVRLCLRPPGCMATA